MIDRIIYYSLHNKVAILVGVVVLILCGIYAMEKMDIDVFPDLTAPTVVVMTDCHGMAAEETERLVTFPIETALNGATNVRRVRSASHLGYSYVWAEFDWGMDVFRARQIVSEKMVTLAESLPQGITPVLAPQSSVMGEILFVGLQSDSLTTPMELRSLAEWVIKPAILSTGGVSQVTIIGGEYKQYQVLADPRLMDAYGVSMEELAEVVQSMSQNTEGGVIRDYGNEYALRGMGRTNDLQELSKSPIPQRKGITVGDVAHVVIAPATQIGTASLNSKPGVILSVSKQPNINTLQVTQRIEKKLEQMQGTLPKGVEMDTHVFRQADFIEASVNNVGKALIEGAILCVIVLFLFLGSVRTTLISVIAIPLSLLGTLIILWLLGMNINTMTLGGMCIAIGSLVDDAIIDVENVYKRLKTKHASTWQETMNIIYDASREIRSSILNATLIVIVAFTPMFFLSGMEGRMLKPLGITYIIALGVSLLVAMTITPLCCRLLLADKKYLEKHEREHRFITRLSEKYGESLEWILNHKRLAVGMTVAAFIMAISLLMSFGSSFLPPFNEGALTITAVSQPGVSLQESDHIGQLLEKKILEVEGVASTSRRTGRGDLDEHSQTSNSSEVDVKFDTSGHDGEEITRKVREKIAEVPGVTCIVGQPLGHRIDHMISGTQASIAIKLFGADLNQMYMTGCQIKQAIADIPGLVDINVDQQTGTPQLQLRPRRAALARYGLSMQQFNELVKLAFSGEKMGDIYEGQHNYDLILKVGGNSSHDTGTPSLEEVRHMIFPLEGQHGGVPLEDVCEIVSTSGPNTISRENVQRKLVIAANVQGRDVGSVVKDIQARVNERIKLPSEYRIEYGGQFESAKSATRTLIITTLLALCIIYLLLFRELKSFSLSSIVMVGLPLAMIGGVVGIALSSWVTSIPSIIGFITLFGIATRNGILLISRYQKTITSDNLRPAIIEGARDRLNPILMTALTSALALIPLVMNGDKAGNEIQSPMAIVVLGGLLTSTILNLYIMPVIFEWYSQKTNKCTQHSVNARILLLALLALLPGMATESRAQDFTSILQSIEQHCTSLETARLQAEAEKADLHADMALDGPEVEAGYLFGNNGIGNRVDVSVSQAFDFPTVIAQRRKLTRERQRVADMKYLSERQQLLLTAHKLCLEVVYCNAIMEHLEEDLEMTRAMSQSYEKLYQQGEATSIDHNKAHQALLLFEAEYREFHAMRKNLLAELQYLNGGQEVTISDNTFEHEPLSNDFENWLRENIDRHPTLQLAQSEVDASEKSVALARSQWAPKISVGYMGEFEREDHYQGPKVGLSIPIWSAKRKIKAERIRMQAAQAEEKDKRDRLIADLRSTYNEALQLQETYKQLTKHLTECDNSTLLRKSLDAGQITLLTYLEELQSVHEIHEKLLSSERDLELRKAELNF